MWTGASDAVSWLVRQSRHEVPPRLGEPLLVEAPAELQRAKGALLQHPASVLSQRWLYKFVRGS